MKRILISAAYHIADFFLSATQFSFSIARSRRFLKEARHSAPFDMLIVPGVPLRNGKWDFLMKSRVVWAKYLYDQKLVKNVMFSGAAVYSPYYEGAIMAEYAKAIGIPAENVYDEIKAEHSTENVYYSYLKSKKLGFNTMALASDPFQTRMLRRFTRNRVSPEIALLPVVYPIINSPGYDIPDPGVDSSIAFAPGFVSIRDRMKFRHRFKGTRGHHIDPNAY